MALAELLGLRFGFCAKDVLQIAEILRTRDVTFFGRGVAVKVPKLDRRLQAGAKPQVEITMLCAPLDGFRAEDPGNPDRRARLLVRGHPRIHKSIVEMFTLPTERTRGPPRRQELLVGFGVERS